MYELQKSIMHFVYTHVIPVLSFCDPVFKIKHNKSRFIYFILTEIWTHSKMLKFPSLIAIY